MLSDDQIRAAWAGPFATAASAATWGAWEGSYAGLLQRFSDMSPAEFRSRDAQEALWSAEGAGTIGQGEHIHVAGAWTDVDIIERFLRLRGERLPADTDSRAATIQAAATAIMTAVHPKHTRTKHKPLSKLHRALAVLLPDDIHCAYSWSSNDHVTDLLVGKQRGRDVVADRVYVMARLRVILPNATTVAEKARRSTFCWWLHEHYSQLTQTGAVAVSEPPGVPLPAAKPIEVWPFGKQLKGIFSIKGLGDCFREVVRAAVEGPQRDDLFAALRAEPAYDSLSLNSWRLVLTRVQTLGLIEARNDRYFPTPAGEELLDTGDFDVLIERLLQRVYGFAQLLRLLSGATGLTQAEVYEQLRGSYPQWTTDRVPAAVLHWCRNLGLVKRSDDKRLVLTEDGASWHTRLPERLPNRQDVVEVGGGEEEDEEEGAPRPAGPLRTAALAAIEQELEDDPEASRFHFRPDDVRALHLSWHALDHKRFVLLTGLAGTGKTQMLRQYARAYCRALGLEPSRHVTVVSVGPDWRDPASLVGYFNALHEEPTFHREPATIQLIRASAEPGDPFFLILDEMNLARPEHYFAPFLSAMETGEPIRLHGEEREINGVPAELAWPRNLFIGGTVNIDETTHAFSDKVLDRAFTLEFWDIDLEEFFERRARRDHRVEAVLRGLYAALRPIRRHFGYRTAEEVLRFVEAAQEHGLDAPAIGAALDHAIAAKVLPHLRGEAGDAEGAVQRLAAILPESEFPRSAQKVEAMRAQLERTGLMGFF